MTDNKERPEAPIARATEFMRKPGAVVAVLSMIGIAGPEVVTHVNTALAMDLPGWVLLLLFGGYVFVRMGYDHLKSQRELIAEFRAFRDETRGRLKLGDELLAELTSARDEQGKMLGVLWNIHKAEIEAYQEKTRRETGKVQAKP